MTTFQAELAYFDAHLADLLRDAEGKYAVIKDSELLGIFESENAAVRAGFQRFGNESFLVKHIVEAEVPLNFTSFHLGY
jgi:hypothetical protein